MSDYLYDGILGLGGTGNPFSICSKNNGSGHFADMHLQQFTPQSPNLNAILTFDEAAFSCTPSGFPLPAVPVPTF